MKWQELEKTVKQYAQAIWCAPATQETINGIRCDCVVQRKKDYWIIIEISKENNLSKLRVDLAKFASIKPFLFSQEIYAECIFVTEKEQTSLLTTASGDKVIVYSLRNFFNQYFGAEQYNFARSNYEFGSAVDPDSGKIDTTAYIPIQYIDNEGKTYNVQHIANLLQKSSKIVVLGEFGSGKSRCVMELFKILINLNPENPPIAINLKELWGLRAFHTIITEHLSRFGLSDFSENVIRIFGFGHNIILLDGFDELGTQTWSGDKKLIREVRKKSFEGFRDLIQRTMKCGVLVTGREHYFNDNSEMFECLGLSDKDTLLLKCPNEFTEEETSKYLENRIGITQYPKWFPRKPLICQVLTKLDSEDIKTIFQDEVGEIKFFEKTLEVICKRETKHNPAVYPDSVRQLYFELARLTKEKNSRIGPLTKTDIYSAFEKVTNSPPLDESVVLLQRLAYLGRTGSGSDDRVFIDEYIVDGLTAFALVEDYFTKRIPERHVNWKQPIGNFGLKIIGRTIKLDTEFIGFLKKNSHLENIQITSDYFAGVLNENDVIDLKNLQLINANIQYLNLVNKELHNLSLVSPTIEELTIENSLYFNTKIVNGIFGKTYGISSKSGFPTCFENCSSTEYDSASDVSKIGDLTISPAHKTLLCIIKKLFFQPGSGRKEVALLRGSEKYWDEKAANIVISYLISNNMAIRAKQESDIIYIPQRQFTFRLGKMYAELNNSKEELWQLLRK